MNFHLLSGLRFDRFLLGFYECENSMGRLHLDQARVLVSSMLANRDDVIRSQAKLISVISVLKIYFTQPKQHRMLVSFFLYLTIPVDKTRFSKMNLLPLEYFKHIFFLHRNKIRKTMNCSRTIDLNEFSAESKPKIT